MTTQYIVFDTETTGADPTKAKMVEFGYLVANAMLEVLDIDRTLIDPEMPIPADASGVHHICDADVADEPTLDQVEQGFWAPFFQAGTVVIGHNVKYDLQVAKDVLPPNLPFIDTLQLAKRYLPDAPNHKLGTLMYYCKLRVRKNTHSAVDDCMICLDLLKHIMTVSGKTVHDLIDISSQPLIVRVMPFGKHKGLKMEDVPTDYLKWMLREMSNMDENMRYTVEKLARGESLEESDHGAAAPV